MRVVRPTCPPAIGPDSTRSRGPVRGAFTLLEVLLASALAVILMAALYVALDVQLKLADAGREAIEQATVSRAIVQRLEADLANCLGPVAPNTGGSSEMTTEDETTTGDEPEVTGSTAIPFAAGVIGENGDGESGKLTLYVAKVTKEVADGVTPADVRRITYWMTDKGLARQEVPWVTSERLQLSTELYLEDGREPDSFVIAEEVTKVLFSYWDGSSWADTWDGRGDGTVKGPPMAIRVSFWMKVPGQDEPKEFRHTISLLAAPGPAVPE
jgi:prepilin-type N-terminal cleavage/methylation domain-containing protein